jgi:hypothetical protein
MQILARLEGIRKDFKSIAFIGPNPALFLGRMRHYKEVEQFTFIDFCEKSAE